MSEKLKGCFSHKSDHWTTPKVLYDLYVKENGHFDPCPLHCVSFDGLSIPWKEKNFVNPPYSQIDKWVDKAIQESKLHKKVVLLLPVRTDTKWFEKLSKYGITVHFFTGRLKFGDSKNSAPFPLMLVFLTPFNFLRNFFFISKIDEFMPENGGGI